jgi:hypothetical protein
LNFPYKFPDNAYFGKLVSKNKIYEHSSTSSALKKLFIRDVEKITWSYKLSPETINLPAKDDVQEIQVFTIELKTGSLKYEVLQAIDRSIPSPILYILKYDNQVRYVAAYKRQSEADKSKWVVSSYFETDWMSASIKSVSIPVVLDLKTLYYSLLKGIIPLSSRQNETISELVSRAENLGILEREAAKVEARLESEKQFNRKVEINAELRKLKKDIKKIKG